jgi:hypothetical protein
MIVTAFKADGADSGQRRVVLNDLVGGVKMSEQDIALWQQNLDSSPASAPPSAFTAKGQWTWQDGTPDPAESTDSLQQYGSGARRTRSKKANLLGNVSSDSSKKGNRFPPNGGFGKKCVALWSYYPEEGEAGAGELMFPKGAMVGEVEEINEDWAEGVYMGERGLVPMVRVREL